MSRIIDLAEKRAKAFAELKADSLELAKELWALMPADCDKLFEGGVDGLEYQVWQAIERRLNGPGCQTRGNRIHAFTMTIEKYDLAKHGFANLEDAKKKLWKLVSAWRAYLDGEVIVIDAKRAQDGEAKIVLQFDSI